MVKLIDPKKSPVTNGVNPAKRPAEPINERVSAPGTLPQKQEKK